MSERPKQQWRLELGRTVRECKVFLNDEPWHNVTSLSLTAGVDQPTRLMLELLPYEIIVTGDLALLTARGEPPNREAHQKF
jgi:hypothetical protein